MRVSTFGCLVLLVAATAAAQAPPPYVLVHYDQVEPAQATSYEENAREWVTAFEAAAVGPEFGWDGYSSGFDYAWVSFMEDYAYLDGRAARNAELDETVGEETMKRLVADAGEGVHGHYTEVLKYEEALSYQPDGFTPVGMAAASVQIDYVKPAMVEDYKAVVADVIAALRRIEAPTNFAGHTIEFGRGSFGYVTWGESRGALHSGHQMGALLAEAVGPEAAQDLYRRWAECLVKTEQRDWTIRADLSYRPAPPEADE